MSPSGSTELGWGSVCRWSSLLVRVPVTDTVVRTPGAEESELARVWEWTSHTNLRLGSMLPASPSVSAPPRGLVVARTWLPYCLAWPVPFVEL